MRIVQFAKWWWDKNDSFNRIAIPTLLFWIIPCGISTIWIGHLGVQLLAGGVLPAWAGWWLAGFGWKIRNTWRQFEREMPTEDVQIINRLKGVATVEDN
jgi:hypothetical protein